MASNKKPPNAFDLNISVFNMDSDKVTPKRKKRNQAIKNTNITKVCACCGKEYHPTKNGYENISKYCSQKCSYLMVSKKFY